MSLKKQTGIAFALRIITALAAFGHNWILSRLLGAEGLGAYQLAFTVSIIGSIVASLGLNNAVLRLVSANIATENHGLAKGYYRRAIILVGLAAFVMTLIIQLSAKPIFLNFFPQKERLVPLIILMSGALIPTTLNNLFAELLKAFGNFKVSLLMQSGFAPLVTILCLSLYWLFYGSITVTYAIVIFVVALWITLLLSVYFFNKNKPPQLKGVEIVHNDKELLASSMPLWTVTIALTIMESLDILLIGIWIGVKEAGVYAIAKKIASLNVFFLASINTVIAPQFATLYAQNRITDLKNIAQKATKLLFWVGLLSLCIFSLFSTSLLGLFGNEFKEGWLLLIILSVGQFINVITGPVANLLIMTGHQALYRTNMILSSFITVMLFLLLIPTFSTVGAAVASAFGLAFENCRVAWLVHKKLGFYTLKL